MSQHRLFHSLVVGSQLLLSGAMAGCFAQVVEPGPGDPNADPMSDPDPSTEPVVNPMPATDGGTADAKPDADDAQADPRACAPGWHPTKGTVCKVRSGRPASEQLCCGGPAVPESMCCVAIDPYHAMKTPPGPKP
jgi:hypothetical protein